MAVSGKPQFEVPDYISELSEKAKQEYLDIAHSLDVPNLIVTSNDVLEYALEQLYDMERLVGDPEDYVRTLQLSQVNFVESWDATVLNDKNPNAKMLKTLGITGQMVFRWVAERFQFVHKESPVIEPEQTEEETE